MLADSKPVQLTDYGALLQWVEPLGIGWLPIEPPPTLYSDQYWLEYRRRDQTAMGRALTAARFNLARQHLTHEQVAGIVDIGIGGGAFVEAAECRGHDINPRAVDWLGARSWDGSPVASMTMWDVIEHFTDPAKVLDRCTRNLFVSTPIYENRAHVLRSRHMKPGEHMLYATHEGLIFLMRGYGFKLMEHDRRESDLGRDGIGTYVFRRGK